MQVPPHTPTFVPTPAPSSSSSSAAGTPTSTPPRATLLPVPEDWFTDQSLHHASADQTGDLLAAGANALALNEHMQTPLQTAVAAADQDKALLLAQACPCIFQGDLGGATPLGMARERGLDALAAGLQQAWRAAVERPLAADEPEQVVELDFTRPGTLPSSSAWYAALAPYQYVRRIVLAGTPVMTLPPQLEMLPNLEELDITQALLLPCEENLGILARLSQRTTLVGWDPSWQTHSADSWF